jgi:hypothetical protein
VGGDKHGDGSERAQSKSMTPPELQERFQASVDEHKKILYKVCNSYCRNHDDREDLIREIIVLLGRSFGSFDITEMIRVAKPGTKILIVDETEKVLSGQYQKNPLTRRYFAGRDQAVFCPIDLLPAEMGEIKAREFEEGKLYCLTFRKP